jgi:TetR/AcrR family transcriptional repressor of nem operon
MARQKEFERDDALRRAIPVFWDKGFAGASAEDLTTAMGIGRQSLYDTFGDKRRLYLEALGRYNSDSVATLLGRLRAVPSPLAAIEAILMSAAAGTPEAMARGCMGVNAVCEFGVSDPDVAALEKTSSAVLQAGLEAVINEAKAKGEADPAADTRAAARFIGAAYAGMKVAAKAGAPPDILRDIAAFAMRSLKAP